MRKIFIIIFLFCAHIVWAQNSVNYFSDFTNLEKIIDLSTLSFDTEFDNLTYNTSQKGIVFCGYDASKGDDSIRIFELNPSSMVIDKSVFFIKGFSKYLLNNRYNTIQYIAKNEKWMIIGLYERVYIFDENQHLFELIKHSDDYESAKFISTNKLIFFANRRNRKGNNTVIAKYDILRCEFEKVIYPKFNMIEYTHIMGNQWFDVSNGYVIFSQTVQYSINIYDRNLELIDTVRFKGDKWKELPIDKQEEISELNLNGIDAINVILPYEKDISRMEQVFIFNDSTIITYYNVPDGNTNYLEREHDFDIWQKKNDWWYLKYLGYQDLYKEGILTYSNYPIFKGKLSRKIVFSGGYLFAFMPYAPIYPTRGEKSEYLQKCDEYLLDNSPKPLIYIYSVNIADNEK